MNNSSNVGSSVYVDLDALTGWSSQFNQINEESISILNSLISTIGSLNDSWVGNIATGFINDSTEFVESIQRSHNDMKDVAVFLIDVVNTMNNQ